MASLTSGWAAMPRRLRASRSTSTTPATRATAANSCRSSTPITTPTASCRSTLRHHDGPARGDRAQARQDALRQGVALPYPPPCPAYPAELAIDPYHAARRQPLRSARGDGLVRGERRDLSLWPRR